jgi:outer membrane protein assembly factor BamB
MLKVDWHTLGQITLPPIVGGHTVYSLDHDGTLYALDRETGLVRAQLSLGMAVPHFATPTLSQGRVYVGTLEGVSAVTVDGRTDQKAPEDARPEKENSCGTAFHPMSAISTARRRKGWCDVV